MKIKIQIINFMTGVALFEYETEGNTVKKTIEEANLRGANLQRANLQGANLQRANLQRANLWGADLRGANLQRANLQRADLRGANLQGADLQGAKGLKMYWHIHHEVLVENLTEPLKNRIAYIKESKPKNEVALRLKLLKKVKAKVLPKNPEDWEKLHKKECPHCPWDGKSIFPGGNL